MPEIRRDLSVAQADSWIERELEPLIEYDQIVLRIEEERAHLELGGERVRKRYPVAARARSTLIELLKARRRSLKPMLH